MGFLFMTSTAHGYSTSTTCEEKWEGKRVRRRKKGKKQGHKRKVTGMKVNV